METDPLRVALLRSIRGALEGASAALAERPSDLARYLPGLRALGDALRATLPIPPTLRGWLRGVPDDALVAPLRALVEESALQQPHPQDPTFALALRRRDEAESIRAAIAWRSVTTPPGVELREGLDALDATLATFDTALANKSSRADVDALLAERAVLNDRGWRAALPDDRAESTVTIPDIEPGDEILDAWLREGRFHRYVEGHAVADPIFGEHLGRLVDEALQDFRADRTLPVGFVAQRWRQKTWGKAHVTIAAPSFAGRRLAASTESSSASRVSVDLGLLAPLAASARIDCEAGTATLQVYADPGALSRVTWGGREATASVAGVWSTSVVVGDEPVPAVVVARDGTRLEFDVNLSIALEG
jgi:hypothetical protein